MLPMLNSQALSSRKLIYFTSAAMLVLLAWDASGLDMLIALFSGNNKGFALRDNWLLTKIFHDGMQRLSWMLIAYLGLAIWWPLGVMTQLTRSQRLQLLTTTLLAALAVSILKSNSATSCPWDLSAFGGMAHYASHWTALTDGGSGGCFPAGHASTGFAFLSGYFVFRETAPKVAHAWLSGALIIGLILGIAQQMRGAHFMSHTLWTAWICWAIAFAMDSVWRSFVRIKI